jgi:hypothetical protein
VIGSFLSAPFSVSPDRGDEAAAAAVDGERRGARRRGGEGRAAAAVVPPSGQQWKARKQAPSSWSDRFVQSPASGGGAGAGASEEADDGAGGGQGQALLLAVLPRLEAPHLPGQKHCDTIPY